MLRAFPLQFPHGVGGIDIHGNERRGITYYRYLRQLSNPDFHRAEFVTILHNMYERSKLINGAYCKLSDMQLYDVSRITGEELRDGLHNYINKEKNLGVVGLFLSKMKALTNCLAHTEEAPKQARQNLFSMISHFGLPSIMFTITPQDDYNFRIKYTL